MSYPGCTYPPMECRNCAQIGDDCDGNEEYAAKRMICPLCGKSYREHPAISRTDNETEICPDCGIQQALEAAGFAQ